jgi:VWFA-related protein
MSLTKKHPYRKAVCRLSFNSTISRFAGRALMLSLAIFSILSLRLGSQQSQTQKVLRHETAAVVKLVPVRVLNQDGRLVTDLKKEDFVLYDNGELQKITEFEVHSLEELGKAPEKTGAAQSGEALKEKGRKYFILLDIQASDPIGQQNAKKAAQNFIDSKLKPEDEVSVLYYAAMTGLNMVTYLTSDKNKIKKAIERAKEVPPGGPTTSGAELEEGERQSLAERAWIIIAQSEEAGGGEASGTAIVQSEASDATPGWAQGSMAVGVPGMNIFARSGPDFQSNMSELAKAMRYIPGSKNLLFFSGRSVYIDKSLGREFAASNTPVFTVNTKNWIVKGIYQLSIKKKYIYTEHSLKEFALASGGQYFADIKDIGTISDEIQTLTSNYYVLGYYIDEKWDGKMHQIKVEVKRPDCKVLAQDGYYNPKPFAEQSDIEKKLQLFDLAFADTPTVKNYFEIPLDPLLSSDGKGSNVVILSKMPVDEKVGIPPGKAEFYTFIFDKDNKAVQSTMSTIDLAPQAQKTIYPYATASLEPGEYECRFVARDTATGQAVIGKTFFKIPEPLASGMKFDSPLLFVPGKDAQFLKISRMKKGADLATSLISFYPLLPMHCSPLVKNLEADDKVILAVIAAVFPADQLPEVNLDVRMTLASTGEEFPLEARILEAKRAENGKDVLMLEIDLPDLRPGEYELEIKATESTTQAQSLMKTSIVKK